MRVPTEYLFTVKTNYGESAVQYRCREFPPAGWRPVRDTYDTRALRVRCYRTTYQPARFGWLFSLLCQINLPHLAQKLPGYWGDPLFWTEYKV